jgi:hypothetical protein
LPITIGVAFAGRSGFARLVRAYLGEAASVSLSTVRRVENDEPSVKHARQTLIQALKNEGIEFIQNE